MRKLSTYCWEVEMAHSRLATSLPPATTLSLSQPLIWTATATSIYLWAEMVAALSCLGSGMVRFSQNLLLNILEVHSLTSRHLLLTSTKTANLTWSVHMPFLANSQSHWAMETGLFNLNMFISLAGTRWIE